MPTPIPLALDSTELRRIADTLDNLSTVEPDLGEPHLEVSGGFRIAFPDRQPDVAPVPLRRITTRQENGQ